MFNMRAGGCVHRLGGFAAKKARWPCAASPAVASTPSRRLAGCARVVAGSRSGANTLRGAVLGTVAEGLAAAANADIGTVAAALAADRLADPEACPGNHRP